MKSRRLATLASDVIKPCLQWPEEGMRATLIPVIGSVFPSSGTLPDFLSRSKNSHSTYTKKATIWKERRRRRDVGRGGGGRGHVIVTATSKAERKGARSLAPSIHDFLAGEEGQERRTECYKLFVGRING